MHLKAISSELPSVQIDSTFKLTDRNERAVLNVALQVEVVRHLVHRRPGAVERRGVALPRDLSQLVETHWRISLIRTQLDFTALAKVDLV